VAVIAKFIYEVKPGRMGDFMAKLRAAADPKFNSPVMPKSFRLFRSTVPGPDTGHVVMLIEYEDMAGTVRAQPMRTPTRSGNNSSPPAPTRRSD
jgi:hypothetical protein